MSKVFVLGIDGTPPEYIFGEWLDELPNFKKLMQKGCYAKLNSSVPPLSGIAWTSMVTGKKPAEHGIFEYIYRRNFSYDDIHVVTAKNNKEKTIWEIAGENNKKAISCLVPFTWPIKPFEGICICGFGIPKERETFVWPKEMKPEIDSLFEKEGFRVSDEVYRNISKEKIMESAYNITGQHFRLIKYLLENKKWDLFFGVIIQSDSMNHNFLKFVDKEHRKYKPDSRYKNVLKDYYKFVDKKLGELLELLDEDTKIIVLSDHGITRMHNRVNLSDWLIKEGYLILKDEFKELNERIRLKPDMIDWEKTKAWAIGAYEGQIYINLKEREPKGIVEEKDYDGFIEELEKKLKKITGDKREKLNTKIFTKKRDMQGKCQDIAPDIIIYFDDLHYGCNTSLIGNKILWSPQTAKGSDDAGHSRQGIFVMKDGTLFGDIGEIDIIDVAPTILNLLEIPIPEEMKGRIIERKNQNRIKKIDLHIHTSASDGELSPKQTINLAIEKGMEAIAITDHDTIGGLKEALEYSKDKNIKVIPGVEISCDNEGKGVLDIHIIGLFIDCENKELNDLLKKENRKIKETIETIKKAGGLSVLAHPVVYVRNIMEIINEFVELGGESIEVYYPYDKYHNLKKETKDRIIDKIKKIADEKNLLISGGSDFHGKIIPMLGLGEEGIEKEDLEKLYDFKNKFY